MAVRAKLSLDRASYARHKAALKELERVVRKAIIEKALMAGGTPIHADAEALAPGPLAIEIVGGRTLRTKVDPKMAKVVKANAKLAAIGPDAKHWYYRFFEFGATAHDIAPKRVSALRFTGRDGTAFARHAHRSGGVRMRPFLRPAVDRNKDVAVKAMARVLESEIKKAARG